MQLHAIADHPHVHPAAAASGAADPILEVRDVTKDFAGFVAVRDVNLQFKARGITAIIGPNGAGKTTLFNLLSGFLKPTRGSIIYRGVDISRLEPQAVSRLGVVRSFQIISIFGNLTVAQNLLLSLQSCESHGTEFWRSSESLERYLPEALELMDQVRIDRDWLERPASSLPYGLKRALELGISLAMKPDVLLLDEPTAGMAVKDIPNITSLISRVSVHCKVILVEHNLRVVEDLASEIIVMQQGCVLTVGTYREVREDPRVIEAYLGGHGHANA